MTPESTPDTMKERPNEEIAESLTPDAGQLPPTLEDVPSKGRRRFLKGMFGAAAAAIVGGQPLKELVEEELTPEQVEKELREYSERLREEFGVGLDFREIVEEGVLSRELSLAERRDFARCAYETLLLYPGSYVKSTGLKTMQGVKWLTVEGKTSFTSTIKGAVSKEDLSRIVINKEDPYSHVMREAYGWTNAKMVRAAMHHEFYHIRDPHLLDDTYNQAWVAENSPAASTQDGAELPMIRQEDFASRYGAQAGAIEDRAEIASLLFSEPLKLKRLCMGEPVLKKKVEKIKKEYFDATGGLMDETYWKLLEDGNMTLVREYLELREKLTQGKAD